MVARDPRRVVREDERADFDVEREWAQARAAAGLSSGKGSDGGRRDVEMPVDVSPFSLLYSGFFLGPGATLALGLYLIGRRLKARDVALLVGVCGLAWSLAQGLTFLTAGEVPPAYVQMVRSGVNFAAGGAVLWWLWRRPGVSFLHDRQSMMQTAVLGFLFVSAFMAMPQELQFWLGR